MDTVVATIEVKPSDILASTSGLEPSNPCPICLGPFLEECYLDTCYHEFCFKCIEQWARVVAGKHPPSCSSLKCPLCKTDNFSIIHGYDGNSFQRKYFNPNVQESSFFTKAHKYRLQCYYTQSVEQFNSVFNVSRFWKLSKFRLQNRWLKSWLQREVQALVLVEDIDIILHHILGVMDSFLRSNQSCRLQKPEEKREEFKSLVANESRTFLRARTDRFVDELELFLASELNLAAYDAVYLHQLGWDSSNVIDGEREGDFSSSHPVPSLLHVLDFLNDEKD